MRILLHSHSFHPVVGGVETIAVTLAEQLHKMGHEVTVVTETPDKAPSSFPFQVLRCPSVWQKWNLARSVDIIHANGTSLVMVPYAALVGTPFVWTHNGYQASCVDGLGWSESGPTPMEPWPSIWHYFNELGPMAGAKLGFKLILRRLVAQHFAYNVAATHWVARRQPLPNQQVAYTPYPLGRFAESVSDIEPQYDFIFVGRLVSEKGIETLIRAMAIVHQSQALAGTKLAIVGDGLLSTQLKELVKSLGLDAWIHFLGTLRGADLSRAIRSAPIGIVPSAYEEPMGGIALELLASGRCVIVSERGGMAECVGAAGVCFENGNPLDLADKMIMLVGDEQVRSQCLERAGRQLRCFDELNLTQRYVELYQEIVHRHRELHE